MAAPNSDAMRGGGGVGGGGPASLVPGPVVRQVVHHQQLPPGSHLPPQQHAAMPPNHHIQQLQNLTQQQTSTVGAHSSGVVHANAIHQQQQHRTQQLPARQQQQQQLFHHQQQQQQHKISQFSGNINNLVFASTENASAVASGEMNLARSGLSGRDGGNVVVNIASVNPSGDASVAGSVPLLASNSASAGSSNSTSINPVVNRITTSVNHIPVENVQVLQQHQQQLNEAMPSSKASTTTTTMSPRATNVAPGWRRIKYNCEIIYISPSGAPLRNFNQVKEYLLSGGTCKCGLPCPFRPEAFFEFDSQVPNASLDSNVPHNFCLHHTGYMEKVEIVRRGKKVIESDGSSSKDLSSISDVASFTNDMRLPVPANNKFIGSDGTISSNIPTHALGHGPATTGVQQVILQTDKEISSIPLSKTPPWRKNNSSSTSTSIGKPNSVAVPAAPVVMNQRQIHSSSVLVPGKTTTVQSANQNEQIVKHSRIINEPQNPTEWPSEEGLSIPHAEASKVKSTTKKRPNFKDDPTGYLNQQTAILHSSISTLHSPDGSSSSQEGTHLKTVIGYDSGELETPPTDQTTTDDGTSTTLGGQTVTHIANGMVQVQQNCDISHMKLQQQMQFQQQLQRQSQLVRQHHEQLQLLQQQQQQQQHQQQSGEGVSKNATVRFVTTAQESPVSCNSVTFTTSRTPDVTSTSPSTPDLKGPVQGGSVSTSNRSPMLQGNLVMTRSESPEAFSNRNFIQSTVGAGLPKNQSISNNGNIAYSGHLSVPRNVIPAKPFAGMSSVENKITKSTVNRENDTGSESSTGAVVKTEKVLIQNSGTSSVVGFNQQGQMITQQHQQQPQQQVLMTSNGQIIVMAAQPNKNSNTIVMSGNPNNPGIATSISPNVIIPQQSMVGVNTSQYMSAVSSGNTVSTVTASSNNSGIMQNIAQHQPQQPNIIHHSQSNANSSFLINPQNNMQPTVILNSGNVIQSGGQQILTAANSPQMIHSGNVLTTAGTAQGPKMISGNGNAGIITNQSNINQLLSLPPNSIVIQQPNYNSVPEGGQIVNQVINQDGTTTSYIQQQQQQQNPQRQILISTDAKRKAKKRKSNGSTNPMLSPQQQPQLQQASPVTQQTLQQIGQSGTMLQLTPPFPTQSFQLSQGISGLTIVPNKNPQPPQQQQQQILLQNGQIITQPYNIISQQVLLPAGLVMAPDATTLVQIQNVAAPCGTIINTPQGMMIRAQSPHQQKSFLSPSSGQQFIMNSSGQISPMGAQMYGGPVNIVVPQQQAGTAASFMQQGTAILQQSQAHGHMVNSNHVPASSSSLNTSTDSSTASESPSLPTTPQPAPIVQQKSLASSYLSGTASPPDTTTHSPNSPECASSEKSGGSADSMSMAMVQCVSSSEPDFVPPSIADGAQSPSESTEMFDQGGISYQRIAYKSSEPKIRRIQTPTHQSSFAVRSTAGAMHDGSHSGNTIISTSLPSPQINQHHQQQQQQQQHLQNHILRHQQQQQQHSQQSNLVAMPHASSPSTSSGGVQPDSHGDES